MCYCLLMFDERICMLFALFAPVRYWSEDGILAVYLTSMGSVTALF